MDADIFIFPDTITPISVQRKDVFFFISDSFWLM